MSACIYEHAGSPFWRLVSSPSSVCGHAAAAVASSRKMASNTRPTRPLWARLNRSYKIRFMTNIVMLPRWECILSSPVSSVFVCTCVFLIFLVMVLLIVRFRCEQVPTYEAPDVQASMYYKQVSPNLKCLHATSTQCCICMRIQFLQLI